MAKKSTKRETKRTPKRDDSEGRVDAPGPDLTGTITSFTAENPTTVTMDGEDTNMLEMGDSITLEPLTGDPDAMTAITGAFTVASVAPITLNIDLSAANVDGLTADFLREASDVLPEGPPNHLMASASPGPGTLFHPVPGVGSVPVEGWVPPEGWTPPQGWGQEAPPREGMQPGEQFPTPKEDRPDTIPGGREIADRMEREGKAREDHEEELRREALERFTGEAEQLPADNDPLRDDLAHDFDDIARREGIK